MGKTFKSHVAFFLFLNFLSWCSPSFAISHRNCGTSADPNYRRAFYSLENAIDYFFLGCRNGDKFFPEAGDEVLDASCEPVFYYEGSLLMEMDENDFFCRRVMEKAVKIDVPQYIYQGEDKPFLRPPKPASTTEERIFPLEKDYSSLLSVFEVVKQDAALVHESNVAFLQRRIKDSTRYYKSGVYDCFQIRSKDYKEMIDYYTQQYQYNNNHIEKCKEAAVVHCKESLDYCIAHHASPLAYVDRGLFDYLDGNIVDALERLQTALKQARPEELEELKDKALLLKGRSELEAGLYTDAVLTLSELIHKHPDNKNIYFERAEAYFELGDFDLSLTDYLASQVKIEPIPLDATAMLAFSLGLAKGITLGGTEAGIEFIPSILSSLHGIGHGLWAFGQDPVQMSKAFVQASQDCINFIKAHTPQETLAQLVPELKDLIEKWDQLENEKKGEITGNVIGKYGVDIFIGAGFTKAMKAFRELKRANNLLTYQAMSISERNRSLIKLEAAKRVQRRQEILKKGNLKIQPDKQGKHLVDHRNYKPSDGKSILEHPNPQKLVDEFAGKGMKVSNFPPGTPNYQEKVNFGEFIGYTVERETGEKIATSWGTIHYAKDGVHIVPTKPRYP